jgi:hypothetical protein
MKCFSNEKKSNYVSKDCIIVFRIGRTYSPKFSEFNCEKNWFLTFQSGIPAQKIDKEMYV